MEKIVGTLLSILLFTSLGFAIIISTGDEGAGFATDTAIKMCNQENISSVFICTGNVVKAVSSVPG